MNDGLDEGAAERIQKEQVFLIKPSLSLFAHSQRLKKSRRSEQKKAGQEHQTKRSPVLSRADTQISGATASWSVITRVFVGFNLPPIALAKRRLSSRQRPLLRSFSFSFFFLSVLYIATSALHRRHSNVPRRLFSGRHWHHVAALSRQHRSRRGCSFTWYGLAIIKNNNVGSISSSDSGSGSSSGSASSSASSGGSSSSTHDFVRPRKHPASTLRAPACGHSSNTKKTKADQSCDSLRPFLPACKKNMR